jgi:hypothetical protein
MTSPQTQALGTGWRPWTAATHAAFHLAGLHHGRAVSVGPAAETA